MEVLPASTTRSWQLTKLPASLAKYRAASAISFANPVLFNGTERARLVCSLFIFLSFSSSVSVFALPEPPQNIGVAIAPGDMELTLILCCPTRYPPF